MAATGTITIDGKEYVWTSPTLGEIEQFEATIGPITEPKTVNSVKGRVHLACCCLKEKQPDITAGIVGSWRMEVWEELWEMICQAIPVFEVREARPRPPSEQPVAGEDKPGMDRSARLPSPTSSPSPSSTGGNPTRRDGSA